MGDAALNLPRRAWLEGACSGCGRGWRCPATDPAPPACSHCGGEAGPFQRECLAEDGSLLGCLACGHDEMYQARDFPRTLGIAVVVAAAALAPFTMYLSLAVGAALDAGLVFVVPKRVHCYRCGAVHHRFPRPEVWRPFDLEVADLHRFGRRAAVAQTLGQGHLPPDGRRREPPPG